VAAGGPLLEGPCLWLELGAEHTLQRKLALPGKTEEVGQMTYWFVPTLVPWRFVYLVADSVSVCVNQEGEWVQAPQGAGATGRTEGAGVVLGAA